MKDILGLKVQEQIVVALQMMKIHQLKNSFYSLNFFGRAPSM